jgi:hypothetical protein
MPHPNEKTLRVAYAAFAQGDLNGISSIVLTTSLFVYPEKVK